MASENSYNSPTTVGISNILADYREASKSIMLVNVSA
jgi:hypothetical protein